MTNSFSGINRFAWLIATPRFREGPQSSCSVHLIRIESRQSSNRSLHIIREHRPSVDQLSQSQIIVRPHLRAIRCAVRCACHRNSAFPARNAIFPLTHNPLVLGSNPSGPICLSRGYVESVRSPFGRFMLVACPSPKSGGLADLRQRWNKQVVDRLLESLGH